MANSFPLRNMSCTDKLERNAKWLQSVQFSRSVVSGSATRWTAAK